MSVVQTFNGVLANVHQAHNGRIGLSFTPNPGDTAPLELTASILPATDAKGGISFNGHQFVQGKTYQITFTQTN